MAQSANTLLVQYVAASFAMSVLNRRLADVSHKRFALVSAQATGSACLYFIGGRLGILEQRKAITKAQAKRLVLPALLEVLVMAAAFESLPQASNGMLVLFEAVATCALAIGDSCILGSAQTPHQKIHLVGLAFGALVYSLDDFSWRPVSNAWLLSFASLFVAARLLESWLFKNTFDQTAEGIGLVFSSLVAGQAFVIGALAHEWDHAGLDLLMVAAGAPVLAMSCLFGFLLNNSFIRLNRLMPETATTIAVVSWFAKGLAILMWPLLFGGYISAQRLAAVATCMLSAAAYLRSNVDDASDKYVATKRCSRLRWTSWAAVGTVALLVFGNATVPWLVDDGPLSGTMNKVISSPTAPREEGVIGTDGTRSCLRDLEGQPVDFLIVIMPVYWGTALMVRDINRIHRPRYIWFLVVAQDSCPVLEAMAPNVRCVQENEIFNGHWSAKMLRKFLDRPKRAGWYFYQQLNFQVAFTLSELSETYIVWDADTIPTSTDLRFFDYDNNKVIFHMNEESINASEAMAYHRSYEILSGLRSEHPPHINFVSHFMPFRKQYAREVIHHVAAWRGVPLHQWMFEVTKTYKNAYLGPARMTSGFADYEMYGSWVAAFHPETIMLQTDWYKDKHLRYPMQYPINTTEYPIPTTQYPTMLWWIFGDVSKTQYPTGRGGEQLDVGEGYVMGSCVPDRTLYESWQQKLWTVTYELAKFDEACEHVPYQPNMVDFQRAPPAVSWVLEAKAPESSGSLPVLTPVAARHAACVSQWSLLGRNKRTVKQLRRALPMDWKEGGQESATSSWRHVDAPHSNSQGAWYRQIAEDNTMVYMAFGGSAEWVAARRNVWAAALKSLRDPKFGNWAGPIVVVCSEVAELMHWLSLQGQQKWMKCRSYATTKEAAKTLPPVYGSPEDNPCAISFIRYRASWYATQQDYRRVKMAVHEVMDLEIDRRQGGSPIASDGTVVPVIEHAIYLDGDMTVAGPIATYLAFLAKKYRGEAMTIWEQPGETGPYHGGLWHTHLYLGRNFSTTWRQMHDLGGVRWLEKPKTIYDQPALNRAVATLARADDLQFRRQRLSKLFLMYVGAFGTCEDRLPRVNTAIQCFEDPANPYPMVPGEHEGAKETGIVLHWTGFDSPAYRKFLARAYEPHWKALGVDFIAPALTAAADDGWNAGTVEVEWTVLHTLENVQWSLKDTDGKPIVAVVEPQGFDNLQEVLNGVLLFLQPIYVVVLVGHASMCAHVRELSADLDELLCEAPQEVSNFEQQRNFGYGGRSEPLVAQRAVLCEVSTMFDFVASAKTGAYSDYFLLWDDTAVPLPAMKENASSVLFDSAGRPAWYVTSQSKSALKGEDICHLHGPWLLAKVGQTEFLASSGWASGGGWRRAFTSSPGCMNAVLKPHEFKPQGSATLWKTLR
eukprot:TRINITY_DN73311_c0_g1_i1.p1 TRINITY_DN73311_c0_g1~~TRINITY_DN73311_c0_g1_i1.p1  ORF type:complete len:1398 (-),score=182.86 TRINITY_DN73311_c0_g1_i1:315-4508(-)